MSFFATVLGTQLTCVCEARHSSISVCSHEGEPALMYTSFLFFANTGLVGCV